MSKRPAVPVLVALAIAVASAACARSSPPALESRLGSPDRGASRDNPSAYAPRSVAAGSQREPRATGDHLVYFSSDSVDLTPEARQTISLQADWLRRHPDRVVTVEGHADERGTREYNIALGARRANAVKAFLVAQGIDGARVRTTSYGKERPIAACNDISCWSQNRRAETVPGAIAVSGRY